MTGDEERSRETRAHKHYEVGCQLVAVRDVERKVLKRHLYNQFNIYIIMVITNNHQPILSKYCISKGQGKKKKNLLIYNYRLVFNFYLYTPYLNVILCKLPSKYT